MRTGGARDIDSSVYEDLAARPPGERQRRMRQLEERSIREVLFTDLDEIHAPTDRALYAIQQGQAGELPPVGDIAEKRAPSGECGSWSFS